jgi:hypothetical protein
MDHRGKRSESRLKLFITKDREQHRSEFIASIIINLIIWYIANNIVNWNLSFISPIFTEVLGILNLLLISTILINFIFIFYHPGWFRNMLRIVIDILGIITAYTFLTVFPFILNQTLAFGLTILIILGIIGGIIGMIIHILKFLYGASNK